MIYAKTYGQVGPHIIIIHGLFGNSDNWHSIANTLSEQYQVHCLDLPNHGLSSSLNPITYPAMAKMVYQWILDQSISEAYLLGHSMGGKVAMQLACDYPNAFKKLIVADIAPVDYHPSHLKIFEGLQAITQNSVKSRIEADNILSEYEDNVNVRRFLLKSLIKSPNGFSWKMNVDALQHNYSTILAKPQLNSPFEKPTLFIKGELSPYILPAHRDLILTHFPNTIVKIIPETGHWLHSEKPIPFTSLVRRFCAA